MIEQSCKIESVSLSKVVHCIIFVLLITLPFILTFTQGSEIKLENERFERREMAEFPQVKSLHDLKEFPGSFDKWFSDNFGLRLWLVKLQSKLRFNVFGVSPRENIIVGQNGWYYQGKGAQRLRGTEITEYDTVTDLLGNVPFTEQELEKWRVVLEERQKYLADRGIAYLFAMAPSKALIYPENLPYHLQARIGKTRLEQLQEYLREKSTVNIVDLVQALKIAKREFGSDVPLFLKTDGHWNKVGAFVAYRAIANKASELLPDLELKVMKFDDFNLKYDKGWHHRSFASQMGFVVREDYPYLLPKKGNPLLRVFSSKTLLSGEEDLAEDAISVGSAPLSIAERKTTTRITGVRLQDKAGNGKKFTYAHNFGNPEMETILIMGDSYIAKGFEYFSAHARNLFRQRTELDFSTIFFNMDSESIKMPRIVIQEVCQGYIGKNAPFNPAVVSQVEALVLSLPNHPW